MKNENKNENIRSILLNIISNLLFQIILVVISGSGIIYALPKILKSLVDNTITISILTLIILIGSCMVITISIVLLYKSIIQRTNRTTKHYLDDIEDYYFSEYEKNITIYQNGNGIIIHKFKVIANDVNKLEKIRRKLNVEDGVKTLKFPTLDAMIHTNKSLRFQEFGFWYKSDDNIISEVKEYYWDSKTSYENKKSKNNPQEIRWIFKIDKNKLKKGIPYEICYVISVPGLAALQNGILKKELLHDPSDENSSSIMNIDHKIQKLKYTISFEDGISIATPPRCKRIISGQDDLKELDISGKEDYDLLYRRYTFDIDNPEFGSNISISWKYNII